MAGLNFQSLPSLGGSPATPQIQGPMGSPTDGSYLDVPRYAGKPRSVMAVDVAPAVDNTDPFTMLDQVRETSMKQVMPLFDAQEQTLKSQIGKTKENLYKQYLVEVEGLNNLGLDREQVKKQHARLQTKYKMAYTKATTEIEPAMQEIALERQKATTHVEAAHAERSLRIRQVQALADKGMIDPIAAKQEQLGILGYNVPLSTLRPPTPAEQMRELDALANSVQDVALRFKEENGKFYEDVGSGTETDWVPLKDPGRITDMRAARQLFDQARANKRTLAIQQGRKLGLLDAADAATPMAEAVKAKLPHTQPTPDQLRAAGAWGAGAMSLSSAIRMRGAAESAQPSQPEPQRPVIRRIYNDADYDRLPRGATYIDPKGIQRTKP